MACQTQGVVGLWGDRRNLVEGRSQIQEVVDHVEEDPQNQAVGPQNLAEEVAVVDRIPQCHVLGLEGEAHGVVGSHPRCLPWCEECFLISLQTFQSNST